MVKYQESCDSIKNISTIFQICSIRFEVLVFLLVFGLVSPGIHSRVLNTLPMALKAAFPHAQKVKRSTIYLTPAQIAKASELNRRQPVQMNIVHQYRVLQNDDVIGYAYLDSHRVRTFKETIFVALDKDGNVMRVEILSFKEPPEYIMDRDWLDRFNNSGLKTVISAEKLPVITGSTLSTDAIQGGVIRVLAIHRSLE
ncbi:MAG: FMN-binding protein [Leptospiraceae bacterium]|nr:FMN-binding protein [Leptospiraceae bacterium]